MKIKTILIKFEEGFGKVGFRLVQIKTVDFRSNSPTLHDCKIEFDLVRVCSDPLGSGSSFITVFLDVFSMRCL